MMWGVCKRNDENEEGKISLTLHKTKSRSIEIEDANALSRGIKPSFIDIGIVAQEI
jgi:hypothetical protein